MAALTSARRDLLGDGDGDGDGCTDHDFTSCWNQSFAESNPVQAWLWIDHEAYGDVCLAYIETTLSFDLTADIVTTSIDGAARVRCRLR